MKQEILTETNFLRDGKIDGTFTLFYACGAINETRTYQGGKKDGPGKTFFANGKMEAEFIIRMTACTERLSIGMWME